MWSLWWKSRVWKPTGIRIINTLNICICGKMAQRTDTETKVVAVWARPKSGKNFPYMILNSWNIIIIQIIIIQMNKFII